MNTYISRLVNRIGGPQNWTVFQSPKRDRFRNPRGDFSSGSGCVAVVEFLQAVPKSGPLFGPHWRVFVDPWNAFFAFREIRFHRPMAPVSVSNRINF